MPSDEPDRNVMFGMMAWRLGIVDRETAMSAMYECTLAPNAAFPDVLERQGKLSARDRKRVEDALTATPTEAAQAGDLALSIGARTEAGHDPAQTIESFDSAEQLRSALVDIISGRPHATLAGSDVVPASEKTIAGKLTYDDGGGAAAIAGGSAGGKDVRSRFRILRTHARGGLGEVFVAMDEEVKREVALKQILPRQADNPTSRTRFLLEAEVTGSLEHPGVVPVYGLGQQVDGKPYYAMRFIRGKSLEDAIEQYHISAAMTAADKGKCALELRNLLTRFVAVCNTIEYAHSRGIAHRDLKPENIMLGPYGETLVVDWGLARPFGDVQVDPDVDLPGEGTISAGTTNRPTQMGSIVGTPQFMSPEQAMGRLDLVSARSDVYSLGATLYALLTDQPAFVAADVRKVLTDVIKGNFQPPRQIKKDVPLALDAVCRKAMSLKPEDRYPSAKALAAEIERWLADEPVAALPETRLDRAQRWMRRHKTWTQAGAVAIIAIAAVAGTAYMREAGLRGDLQTAFAKEAEARRDADVARKAADDNAARASREELRAVAHAERAEQQSRLALQTLKSVLFDIQAKLKNVPAAQSVRKNMLDTVVAGLKQVAGSLQTAPEADQSLVRAHLDLGDIFFDAGTSDGGSGATELAENEFAMAEAIATKRFAADAKDAVARRDLGAAYQRLGDVHRRRGAAAQALPLLEKSLKLREAAVAEQADDPVATRELAATLQRLGLVQQELGKLDAAEEFYLQFQTTTKKLVDKDPTAGDERDLAVAYERLGDIRLLRDDVDGADGFFKQCLEVRKRLVELAPTNSVAKRDLSVTFDRLGNLAEQRGDFPAAESFYEQSLNVRKALYEDDPDNMQALRDVLVSYVQLGDISLRRDKLTQAEDCFSFNHEIALQLAASDPGNPRFQADLAISFDRLGKLSERKNQPNQTRDAYHSRLEIVRGLAKSDPDNSQWQRDLSTALFAAGDSALVIGDLAASHAAFTEFADLAKRRLAADAGNASLQRTAADALYRVAMVELRLGNAGAADKPLLESIDLAQNHVDAAADDQSRRSFLANILTLAAQQAWQARDAAAVATRSDRAAAEVRKIQEAAAAPQKKQYDEWLTELATLKERSAMAMKTAAEATMPAATEPALAAEIVDFQIVAKLNAKKFDEAEAAIERLAGLDARNSNSLFLAAKRCVQLGVLDAPRAEKLSERAIKLLQQSQEQGYFRNVENAARLELAPEMKTLAKRPEFQELLLKVRKETQSDERTKPAETKVTEVRPVASNRA
jgi:tetratricopeptide (TPR) repeat protein/tRNA A-37 threonylcarbamoyl transferase component Bud32